MMCGDLFNPLDTIDQEFEEEEEEEKEEEEEEPQDGLRIIDDDDGILECGDCIGSGGDRGACVFELLPEHLVELGIFPPAPPDLQPGVSRKTPLTPPMGEGTITQKNMGRGAFPPVPPRHRRYAYKLYPDAIPPCELEFLNHVSPEEYAGEEYEAKVLFGCLHLSLPIVCVRIRGVKRGLIMPRYTNSLFSLMELCYTDEKKEVEKMESDKEDDEKEDDNDAEEAEVEEGGKGSTTPDLIRQTPPTSIVKEERGPNHYTSNTCKSVHDNSDIDEELNPTLHIPPDCPLLKSTTSFLLIPPPFLPSPPSPPFPSSSFLTSQRYTPIRSTSVITALAYQLLTAIYFCNHMVPSQGAKGIRYTGYTHNDIHLANLLLNAEGRLALCDFELVSPVQAGMTEEDKIVNNNNNNRRTSMSIRSSTGMVVSSTTFPFPHSFSPLPDAPTEKRTSSPLSFPLSSPLANVRMSSTKPFSTPPTHRRGSSLPNTPHSCHHSSETTFPSLGLSLRSSQTSFKPGSEGIRRRFPPLSRRSPDGLFAANADVWAFGLVIVGLLTGVDPLFSNESLVNDFGKGPLLRPYYSHKNYVDWDKNVSKHINYLLSCRSNTVTREEAKGLLKLCSLCLVNAEGRRSSTAEELLENTLFEPFQRAPFLSEQIVQKWINENFQCVPGVSWN